MIRLSVCHLTTLLMLPFLPGAVGCEVSDSDRCTHGYVWSDVEKACLESTDSGSGPDSDEPVNTADSDTGGDSSMPDTADSAPDTDDTASSGTSPELGIGEACMDDEGCATYLASFCLKDPTNPAGEGMCTISDCTAELCGDQLTCCDCTTSAFIPWPSPVCVPNGDVATLQSVGCGC
jgi:hypothetical protein